MRGGFMPNPIEILVWAVIIIICGVWIFGFTPQYVRHHAEAYALALFEAIETVVSRQR
jgi:hypothetical protein